MKVNKLIDELKKYSGMNGESEVVILTDNSFLKIRDVDDDNKDKIVLFANKID